MLDAGLRAALEKAAGREGAADVTLAGMTTLGCGGPAALVIVAGDTAALAAILATASDSNLDWCVLGRGTNLLVSDRGWEGLVIRLTGELASCRADGERLHCGAGLPLPRAAALAADAGLSGLEPLAGIPGSVGGAVAMNAGAFGANMGDLTESIEICLPGETRLLGAGEAGFAYRSANLPPDAVVASATLALKAGDREAIRQATQDFRRRRDSSQPKGSTCGSVFKNPPGGKSAGRLLDEAGCKGLSAGGAVVSEQHANFIINRGGASAADVLELMNCCRQRVRESSGILLEPEVRLLGDIELKTF